MRYRTYSVVLMMGMTPRKHPHAQAHGWEPAHVARPAPTLDNNSRFHSMADLQQAAAVGGVQLNHCKPAVSSAIRPAVQHGTTSSGGGKGPRPRKATVQGETLYVPVSTCPHRVLCGVRGATRAPATPVIPVTLIWARVSLVG